MARQTGPLTKNPARWGSKGGAAQSGLSGVLGERRGPQTTRFEGKCLATRLSQRLWLRPCLNRRQRFAADLGLKTSQPLVDRNQFDNRAPRVDKILKRG